MKRTLDQQKIASRWQRKWYKQIFESQKLVINLYNQHFLQEVNRLEATMENKEDADPTDKTHAV